MFGALVVLALAQLYEYIKTSNPSNKIGYYDVKHEFESTGNNFTLCFNNIELSLNTDCRGHQINHFYTEADMLLINGNHHTASKMILILDGKKEFKTNESHLEKTIAIFYNEQTKTLAEEIKHNYNQCELINGTDLSIIDSYFNFFLKKIQPALHGLILTGGESSRMKENKSLLVYHQQAQWLHLYDLLDEKCEKTFVSCPENKVTIYNGKPIITDTIIGYGPLSGILSGLLQLKNKALLVLACDLPLITKQTINQLIESRDPSKMATAFLNPESNFLEPLITIYEPKALAIMLTMLSQGYTCPRKMLIQNDIKVIHPENPSTLKNINFPEEKEQALEMIKKI